jgi:bla regulator protein BlaR1
MITYFIKSATCLALLLLFYHFILEKEKMHTFNRFYLLGSVLFSLLAPLYIIYIDVASLIIRTTQTSTTSYPTEITSEIMVEKPIHYTSIFIAIYCFITTILLIRFGKNLFHLIHKIRSNENIKYQKAVLVLVADKILPHTFWNYIFINKNDYENQKIEQELFTHELTHVTQRHTLDVLILELIQSIFWINPFFIILKKAVQLNHEFLADETVINEHKNTIQYQHLLVNKAAWKNDFYLASNLNYSLTKKRLKMMTTQSSQTKIWIKKLAVIPLLAGFIFLFAERVEAQEIIKEDSIETNIEEVPNESKKLSESEIYQEYFQSKGLFMFKDKNGKQISKKYNELTTDEKKRIIPAPPLKSKEKIPKQELIEKLKNGKEYAVWIDGKVVKNDILNNYQASDFSSHFVSFIYKNARSKRFPQENQAHLETTEYFENQNGKRVKYFEEYLKKQEKQVVIETTYDQDQIRDEKVKAIIDELGEKYAINSYDKLNKLYEIERNKKPHFIESALERQKELNDLFSKLGSIYFELSKENKKKNKRPIHPHYPYLKLMKNNKVYYKLRSEFTKEDKLLVPPPPPAQNASKEQILKAEKAYSDWEKRTENEFAPPPPPKKEISISNFKITIEKKDEIIKMKCTEGCTWTDLSFNLNKNKDQAIDKFGLTNSKNTKSDFMFIIQNKGKEFQLKSIKGAAWKELKFTFNKAIIDQAGVERN